MEQSTASPPAEMMFKVNNVEPIHGGDRLSGVYRDGCTAEDIMRAMKGKYGGRMEHFGGGTFIYVSYWD